MPLSALALDAVTNDVQKSLGAVLLGSLIGAFLSGTVTLQAFWYFRMYPDDPIHFRVLVLSIWILDLVHTAMVSASDWLYLVRHFGDDQITDSIMWTIAVTVALTAIITFLVQNFFAYRIFTLSKRNWFITLPVIILTALRLAAACVTTAKMNLMQHYSTFVQDIAWVFTLGLATTTAVDIIVTISLCWYLNKGRTGFSSTETIIDAIILYSIETGLLTSIATVITLVCWVTMPGNLVFLGLHFAISKMYANSLLATLNTRKSLRRRSEPAQERPHYPLSVIIPGTRGRLDSTVSRSPTSASQIPRKTGVQIRVEETVLQHVDETPKKSPSSTCSHRSESEQKAPVEK